MSKEEIKETPELPEEEGPQPPKGKSYFHGTGRRKAAIARVRLYSGSGDIVVNGRQLTDIFPRIVDQKKVKQPLLSTETENKFDLWAKVHGGGISSWADAITLGAARALVRSDESFRIILRKNGFLTRDSRVKERKKYGLKRARKAPQYTKR